ncbi:MAG: hypothetical protein H0X50_04650 [Nitrosopumilus sp.]|nr:hypothetical protein [Nitrosopumilus sp.]
MNNAIIIILSFALLFAYASLVVAVFAQNQTPSSNGNNGPTPMQNQTSATVTDKAQTMIVNQTTIPAQQTTITVNQTITPVEGQSQLKPLKNQTVQQQTPNLLGLENKTMVKATGPAITTTVNQTTVPYNQTTIVTGNSTISPQQPPPQQDQTEQQIQPQPQLQPQLQPQQNQSGQLLIETEPPQGEATPLGGLGEQQPPLQQNQNQTKGPLEQLGESVGNLMGEPK